MSLGLSLKLAKKIIITYNDRALSVVKENPYDLIGKVEGIGFMRADDIATKVGIDKKSAYRMKALIKYTFPFRKKPPTELLYQPVFWLYLRH